MGGGLLGIGENQKVVILYNGFQGEGKSVIALTNRHVMEGSHILRSDVIRKDENFVSFVLFGEEEYHNMDAEQLHNNKELILNKYSQPKYLEKAKQLISDKGTSVFYDKEEKMARGYVCLDWVVEELLLKPDIKVVHVDASYKFENYVNNTQRVANTNDAKPILIRVVCDPLVSKARMIERNGKSVSDAGWDVRLQNIDSFEFKEPDVYIDTTLGMYYNLLQIGEKFDELINYTAQHDPIVIVDNLKRDLSEIIHNPKVHKRIIGEIYVYFGKIIANFEPNPSEIIKSV